MSPQVTYITLVLRHFQILTLKTLSYTKHIQKIKNANDIAFFLLLGYNFIVV